MIMNSHEIVEAFFPWNHLSACNCLVSSFLSNVISSCSSMMSISNISCRYFLKFYLKKVRIFDWAEPKNMLNTIIASNISIRLCRGNNFFNLFLDCLTSFESQEDWSDISVLNVSQICPIIFLFICSEFMSFDQTFFVVFDWSAWDQAILDFLTHSLHIHIHTFYCILLQVSFQTEMLYSY